jgi:hypothetical protein
LKKFQRAVSPEFPILCSSQYFFSNCWWQLRRASIFLQVAFQELYETD